MAEDKKLTEEELLKKAKIPEKKAPKWHEFYGGKIETCLKCAVTRYDDFGIWYTPGVAEPCRGIESDGTGHSKDTAFRERDQGDSKPVDRWSTETDRDPDETGID